MEKSEKFDRQIKRYERLRDKSDKFSDPRASLLSGINGNVLEIAPGPGFNFRHYKNIEKLTAVDLSPEMIKSAKKKWGSMTDIESEFVVGNIEELDFPKNSFDSIVSTCSLCTYEDPVAVLNRISKWCKPEGKIYLLEHGLSSNFFMRVLQNIFEPIHYRLHTCHCNRNIQSILEKSYLNIISLKKPRPFAPIDFMYMVLARPKK